MSGSLGSGFEVLGALSHFSFEVLGLGFTHTPLSSSFLGLPYSVLNRNRKKELLRGLEFRDLLRGLESCITLAGGALNPKP